MRIDRQSCIENIGKLCTEYAGILGRVILFGSVARSENTETSDIDLYVEPRDLTMTSGKLERNKAYREFRLKLFDGRLPVLSLKGDPEGFYICSISHYYGMVEFWRYEIAEICTIILNTAKHSGILPAASSTT